MAIAKRFDLSQSLPVSVMFAFAKMAWQQVISKYNYESESRHLVVIPCNNPPLVQLRAKVRLLPIITRRIIAGSCLALTLIVICHTPSVFARHEINWITALIENLAMLVVGVLAYLMFSVRDIMVSDQFSLFVPGVWSANFASLKGVPNIFSNRIFWTDLEEVSIVDKSKSGHVRFCLKLIGKSGVCISMPIKNIPKSSVDLLAREIEKHAPFCRNLSQLVELSRFQDYEEGLLPFLTYNQLWESLTTKRIAATSFMSLQANHKLQDGRLTIVRQIASGGFSAVYLVEEPDGTKLILKEFVLPFGAEQELAQKAAEHFAREAKLLQSLKYEQIAKVYDHFVEDGRNYLLVEYIPGRTLRQVVFEEGPQLDSKVLSYAIQMVEILSYLHGQKHPIIHRDLTPDNFMLSDYGKIFLIDFGSANEFVGTATGTLVGKHSYMAPEQIRGKACPASDIYSFGQTLYYCLSACEPQPLMSSKLMANGSKLLTQLDAIICQCTDLDVGKRPLLGQIREMLLLSKDGTETIT